MESKSLQRLAQQDVWQKIQSGEKIENSYIEELIFPNQEITIEIYNSKIGSVDLSNFHAQSKIHFENVTFESDFICGGQKPSPEMHSTAFHLIAKGCNFESKVFFNSCLFQGIISLQDCVFEDEVHFRKAHFQQQAYFWGSRFEKISIVSK